MAKFVKRPNISAALLFLILTLVFMNRALFPADGYVLGGYDMRGYYYLMPQVIQEALQNGRLPLWDPYRYNGFPLFADPQTGLFYPIAWLMLILPVNLGISWYMVFHIWLAGLGMFLFVRLMQREQTSDTPHHVTHLLTPALLAGISFAFSGFLAGRLWAGHSTVYAVVAWVPWMWAGLVWSVKKGDGKSAVLAAVPFAMSILAGHIASFIYAGILWAALGLYLLLTSPTQATRFLLLRQSCLIALVGLALSAVQLLPFLQFSLTSERVATADFEFATDYSLPPAHLLTLLMPEYLGEPTRIGYWSVPVFEELAYYAGLLSFLALLLALRKPDRLTWFYLILMLLGLWLALGRYGGLYKLFYDLFPPFRIIRAPGRAAYLYLTAVTALLGHTLPRVFTLQNTPTNHPPDMLKWLRQAVTLVGVCGFIGLAVTGALFMAIHPTENSGRLWHQMGGYSLALTVLLLGGVLLRQYLTTPAKQTRQHILLAIALITLCTADMWSFAWKMVRVESTAIDPFWLDAKTVIGNTQERVLPWGLSVFLQNGSLSVGLHSMFGYDALAPGAHLALTSSVPDPRSSVFDLMGVRYVVSPAPQDEFVQGNLPLSLRQQYGSVFVYERARVFPLARLVSRVEVIPNLEDVIAHIHQPDFPSATTAILADEPPCDLTGATGGTADIQTTTPGYWQIHTSSPAPALLVLAENNYPGWRVTIDGETAEPLTAYATLKAVCVPAGAHVVEWEFTPLILWIGLGITLSALLLVLLALLKRR